MFTNILDIRYIGILHTYNIYYTCERRLLLLRRSVITSNNENITHTYTYISIYNIHAKLKRSTKQPVSVVMCQPYYTTGVLLYRERSWIRTRLRWKADKQNWCARGMAMAAISIVETISAKGVRRKGVEDHKLYIAVDKSWWPTSMLLYIFSSSKQKYKSI